MSDRHTFSAHDAARINQAVQLVERRWGGGGSGQRSRSFAPMPAPVDDDDPVVDLRTTPNNETARTDTWTIGDGSLIKRCWRFTYDFEGDQILYGFYWDERIDANGRETYIGPETRYTVDDPALCGS